MPRRDFLIDHKASPKVEFLSESRTQEIESMRQPRFRIPARKYSKIIKDFGGTHRHHSSVLIFSKIGQKHDAAAKKT